MKQIIFWMLKIEVPPVLPFYRLANLFFSISKVLNIKIAFSFLFKTHSVPQHEFVSNAIPT